MPLSRRLIVGAMLAATTVLSPALADVRAGVEAWENGNYPRAVAEWKPLAEQGDPDAQFNLGQAYKLGRGVPADLKLAQSWYEKAAAQDHEEAQANLGLILFRNGRQEAGMVWIRKASDNGDPRARYVLATALFNGDMMAKDWPRAYALMNRAAAQGLMAAVDSLSQMDNALPESQRQEGMKMARDLARQDADREAHASGAGGATLSKAGTKPVTGPAQVASTVPPAAAENPPVPAPMPPAPAQTVEVAAAPVVVAPPAPAESGPGETAAAKPIEVASAAAPTTPAEVALPTWRTGRRSKAAKPARPKAAQLSEPVLAPAPATPSPVQIEAAETSSLATVPQLAGLTPPAESPQPASPVEVASATGAPAPVAGPPGAPMQPVESVPAAPPIAPAAPVKVAVADASPAPPPVEAVPAEPRQSGELVVAVVLALPLAASAPDPAAVPAAEATPAPTLAAPPQVGELASSVSTDAAPAPVDAASASPAESKKPVDFASATPPRPTAPAAKPVAKASPPPLTSAGGKWRVQLGAYGGVDLAKGQWAMLSRKSSALAGLKPSYEPVGGLTRLRVNALTDRAAAEKVCTAAKSAGHACLLIAP